MLYLIGIVIAAAVVGLDRLTKFLAVKYDVDKVIINKLLKFNLTYNTGSAFSFLSGKSWAQTFFIILTFIVLALILAFCVYSFVKFFKANTAGLDKNGGFKSVFKAIIGGKEKKPHTFLAISVPLVFGGALGNLIDRMANKKVVDFIFVFYETDIFPAIFNVADIALVAGMIMLVFYFLFLDKEAVFKPKAKVEGGEKCGVKPTKSKTPAEDSSSDTETEKK